ncbi:hypothetical protein NEOLEDRAFT_1136545 [Neolentinus lepideus HHB14362 ss-1]|uniref:Uncharacterized protein n=1 Tax=Neolentinus lepideus HHB14362 ss-1 TaxID=1314782 RepID=A0A165R970_9AGAM|nr:hypothetical protein NEOLEDRAFT_1136545 [Neolentinus lepideus HHB14362 ss-1]
MSTPKLDVQPGTPAHDWATNTILNTASVNPNPYSTPNLEIPGAYPITKEDQDPSAQVNATELVGRAMEYFPNQEDVVGREERRRDCECDFAIRGRHNEAVPAK